MDGPRAPLTWRIATGIAGAVCVVYALMSLASGRPPQLVQGYGDPFGPILLGAFGIVLAFLMARAGGRDAWHAMGGIVAGLVLGAAMRSFFGFFLGIGLGVPTALLASRPHRIATLLAAFGFAGLVLASATMSRLQGQVEVVAVDAFARAAIFGLLFATLGAGLLTHAFASAMPEEARAPRAGPSRAPLVFVLLALALLLISWAFQGNAEALWMIALPTLVAVPLLRWRAWPVGAVTALALAALGLVPVATCELVHWDPAVGALQSFRVNLAAVAGSGPAWLFGEDGFPRLDVVCSPTLVLAAIAWMIALAVVALRAARLRQPVALGV